MNDKELYEAAKAQIQKGYNAGPLFCAVKDATVIDLLLTLTSVKIAKTANETLADVGGIMWCMEQLEKEQNEGSPGSLEA